MELVSKEEILDICLEQTGFTRDQIFGQNRNRYLVLTRQVFCYVCRNIVGFKVTDIGDFLGKDHTTVIHSCRKMESYFFTKDALAMNYYERIADVLNRKFYHNRIKVIIPMNLDIDETKAKILELGCIISE